jgi:hypothetical protein
MTPHDLITLALKQANVVGVGQTALAEDVNDALTHLNMMLGQWNRKRWLIYHLVEATVPAYGAASYRIGPGMDIDVKGRVTGIASAFYRLARVRETNDDFSLDFSPDFGPPHTIGAGAIDIPLAVLTSREDYSRIGMKGLGTYPSAVWLDADYPVGNLYVWPSPSVGEIHIVVQEQLGRFTDLTANIELPDEYHDALFQNLVVRLRSAYGRPRDPVVEVLAKTALNTIRSANAQIGTLGMPRNMPLGRFGGDMNSYWAGGGVMPAREIVDRTVNVPVLTPVDEPDTIKPVPGTF